MPQIADADFQATKKEPHVTPPQSAPSSPAKPALPKTIGEYRIKEVLGVGGMGIVYRAQDLRLPRDVALKVMHAGPGATIDDLIRFRGEADTIAGLQHDNIVQVYEVGQHEGQPFLVMELIDGSSLAKLIDGKPQPPRRAAEFIEPLARALHYAHGMGIIHRDIKPANVLVGRGGSLKLTDFGLAKRLADSGLSRTGFVMGTPSYMAPEQAKGQIRDLGPAVDIYALGATLYELLTGRPPFLGETAQDVIEQVQTADAVSPSQLVPKLKQHRDLSTICLKCLHKSADRRYATAQDLADDLRRWLDGDPIHARPMGWVERLQRHVQRHPTRATVTVAVCLFLLTGMAAYTSHQQSQIDFGNEKSAKELQSQLRISEELQRKTVKTLFDHSLRTVNAVQEQLKENTKLGRRKEIEPIRNDLKAYYAWLVDFQRKNKADLGESTMPDADLARACETLGQLLKRTGDKAGALIAFGDAESFYELAVNESPHERWLLPARMRLERANIIRDFDRIADAERIYRCIIDEAIEKIVDANGRDEATFQLVRLLGDAQHERGVFHSRQNSNRAALDDFAASGACWDWLGLGFKDAKIPDERRDVRREQARRYGYAGDALLELGLTDQADRAYWKSHEVRQKIYADKLADRADANEARFQLARSFGNHGRFHVRGRSYGTAIQFFGDALKLQKEMVAIDDATDEYVTDLANTYCRFAELSLLVGNCESAIDQARQALVILERLHRDNAGDVWLQVSLADAHTLFATALFDADQRDRTTGSLDLARALLEKLAHPRPEDRENLAAVCAMQAEIKDGDPMLKGRAVKQLTELAKYYGRKHPDDLRRSRAFKTLQDDAGFRKVMDEHPGRRTTIATD